MPITVTNAVETALRTNQTQRFATIWKITREDGTIFRFTDHDHDLKFDGATYTPAGGFDASARAKKIGVEEPSNLDIQGIIDSAYITEPDLRAGRYRDAEVDERLIDWRIPWVGSFLRRVYWLTEIRFSENGWEAQMEGLGNRLQQPMGRLINRKCRFLLGSTNDSNGAGCGVVLAPFTVTGTVSVVNNVRQKFEGSTHAIGTDQIYRHGLLTWTSGSNNGLSVEVMKYTAAARTFWTFLPMPFDIEVGDAYSVHEGCDRERTTCRDKFANIDNYGGFPWTPGSDKVIRTPEAG